MAHRMNRVGTPHLFKDSTNISFTMDAANASGWTAGTNKVYVLDTSPGESLACSRGSASGSITIPQNQGIAVGQHLATPDINLNADGLVLEYDVSAFFNQTSSIERAIPFLVAGMFNTTPVTAGSAQTASALKWFAPDWAHEANTTQSTTGWGGKGQVAFHGSNLGVTEIPFVGIGIMAGNGGMTTGSFYAQLNIRRPNLNETYPKYQDVLR